MRVGNIKVSGSRLKTPSLTTDQRDALMTTGSWEDGVVIYNTSDSLLQYSYITDPTSPNTGTWRSVPTPTPGYVLAPTLLAGSTNFSVFSDISKFVYYINSEANAHLLMDAVVDGYPVCTTIYLLTSSTSYANLTIHAATHTITNIPGCVTLAFVKSPIAPDGFTGEPGGYDWKPLSAASFTM